jgi:Flp pilus assembly protein TadD
MGTMKKSAKGQEPKQPTVMQSQRSLDSKAQAEVFGRAMKVFTAGDFRKAKALFDETAQGPVLSVTETAKMYSKICEQRTSKEPPEPKSPEEKYNFAVGLMNLGQFSEAAAMLKSAVGSAPAAGHIHYALGVSLGRSGDMAGAYEHVKKSIELDPHNRVIAKSDSDLMPLLQDSALHSLVMQYSERPDFG